MRLTALARALTLGLMVLAAAAAPAMAQQQLADPDFQPTVARPAYAAAGPVVVIDEAHNNYHTADGRYAPFATLLRADGYQVRAGTAAFDAGGLDGARVLVIANAGSADNASAFTESEIAAVEAWVRGGGRLLLIADHAPFGVAAAALAARFSVGMGQGWTFEPADNPNELTSLLDYSRDTGRLGDHAITQGRDAAEAVAVVTAFTGQSLIAPEGADVLMRLGPQAWEAATPQDAPAVVEAIRTGASDNPAVHSAAGRAQGLAFAHGSGRVVVLGEAGMLSAQVVRFPDGRPDRRMGMNVATGNAQFGLNIMHWLTGLLP